MGSRITKDEMTAAHRIFNRVNRATGRWYGADKNPDEVRGYMSENRWIMFPEPRVGTLREGTELPMPNIFLSFDDEFADDGQGRAAGWIGLTYNNGAAMLWLGRAITRKNAPRFMAMLKGLDGAWDVVISQKIRVNFPKAAPKYRGMSKFKANKVTDDEIRDAISDSEVALLRPDDDWEGERVLGCITIFSVQKETTHATFDADVVRSFDLFKTALSLR